MIKLQKYSGLILILAVFIVWIFQVPAQAENKSLYVCKTIGWTFNYPADWKVMTNDEIAIVEGRGKTAIENTINEEIEEHHKNLLWLKKDKFNSFTSSIQPYDAATDGPYTKTQATLHQVLIQTYENHGLQFEHFEKFSTPA